MATNGYESVHDRSMLQQPILRVPILRVPRHKSRIKFVANKESFTIANLS